MRYSDFAIENLVRQLAELSMKKSTPKKWAGVMYEAMEVIQQLRKAAAPPNDPLTLDELREMDGEPVWISPVKETGKIPSRWMLVSGYNFDKDIYLFAPQCNITQGYDGNAYGKTWLAYRCKPEEGS